MEEDVTVKERDEQYYDAHGYLQTAGVALTPTQANGCSAVDTPVMFSMQR